MKPGAGNRPVNHRREVVVMRSCAGIVLLAAAVAVGCHGKFLIGPPPIAGSGVSKEETRAVDAFHSLEVDDALQVTVTVTAGVKPGVKISGDDNLVPFIQSFVEDGKLVLRLEADSSIRPKLPLRADVVADELDEVKASGAARVEMKGAEKVDRFTADVSGAAQVSVEGVESSQATASVSGASRIMLSGSAASLKVDASGAGQIKAQSFAVEDADVSISGASSVTLRATKSITGDVSGASQLEVHGSPVKQTVSTSGASQVIAK
jgi:Putative auto-transporter adhesin, head GIN domain